MSCRCHSGPPAGLRTTRSSAVVDADTAAVEPACTVRTTLWLPQVLLPQGALAEGSHARSARLGFADETNGQVDLATLVLAPGKGGGGVAFSSKRFTASAKPFG